jgi:hypothetical protein
LLEHRAANPRPTCPIGNAIVFWRGASIGRDAGRLPPIDHWKPVLIDAHGKREWVDVERAPDERDVAKRCRKEQVELAPLGGRGIPQPRGGHREVLRRGRALIIITASMSAPVPRSRPFGPERPLANAFTPAARNRKLT